MTKSNANQGPEQYESILDVFLKKLGEIAETLDNGESVEKNENIDNDESVEKNENVKDDECVCVFQGLFESFYGGELADESEESESWNVIVYNDDVTTFGEAAEAFVDALGLEIRHAADLVVLIDREGSASMKVAGSYADAHAVFEELRKAGLKVGLELA